MAIKAILRVDKMNEYYLPDDYEPNEVNKTKEDENITYWTKNRIRKSKIYQYYVYKYARKIKKSPNTIIDVGCGTGLKLKTLKDEDTQIIGIDQPSAISYCKNNLDFGEWIADDIENPEKLSDIPKGDLVICSDVIEHLNDPDKLIKYIKEAMLKDGILILSTPERDKLRGKQNRNPSNPVHIREWNNRELKRYLEDRGFKIIDQKNVLPVKISLSFEFLMEMYKALKKFRTPFNNQIIIAKKDE